jgi:CubicO group peptidase (beta-lactamase class C family)
MPVTLEDLWHLGSDTKIMTSTLAAIMIEQGKLEWNSTVSEVFPDLASGFHQDFRDVTLVQLLSHVAGLPANADCGALMGYGSVRDQRARAVRDALGQKPLSAPGTTYLYSNLGYIIAGAIIERVSGMEWEDALTRFVFDPLGMTTAGSGGTGSLHHTGLGKVHRGPAQGRSR